MPADRASAPDTNLLFDAWLVSRSITFLLDEALAPSGLTADEFAVYSVLLTGPLTPTELATWMSAPMTTVSSYVKRFESRGHVRRVENEDDARSYRLTLTRAGVAAHQRAGALFLPMLGAVEDALGRSRGTVERSLTLLERALREVGAPAARP